MSGSTGSVSGGQFSLYVVRIALIVTKNVSACRLNSRLEEIERKHAIQHRWSQSNVEYTECLYTLALDKREHLLISMWKSGQRRTFLLNLKKKYAGVCCTYVIAVFSITMQMGRK